METKPSMVHKLFQEEIVSITQVPDSVNWNKKNDVPNCLLRLKWICFIEISRATKLSDRCIEPHTLSSDKAIPFFSMVHVIGIASLPHIENAQIVLSWDACIIVISSTEILWNYCLKSVWYVVWTASVLRYLRELHGVRKCLNFVAV